MTEYIVAPLDEPDWKVDPADPAAAAEFASWFVGQFLSGRPGVHLIEPSSMQTVEIIADLSGEEILNRLASQE
jgi:hypothetical protein